MSADDKKKRELVIYSVICVILICIIIWLIGGFVKSRRSASDEAVKTEASQGETKKLFDMEPIPEEVITFNTQIIEDGLREMGVLITEEYYFTQVEEYSSTKKLWILDSKAYLAYSYDGVVTAGIDCNDVDISKDDEAKIITIAIPKAYIIGASIDHNSFKLLEEKNGLWNKLDMKDYSDSLADYENAAKEKAVQKGILDKADEGAERMIRSFVNSLVDTDEYSVEYVSK